MLLATRQANKSGDSLLEKGVGTFLGKPADQDDGGLLSKKDLRLSQVTVQASLLLKGEGVWLVVPKCLVSESIVLAVTHQVRPQFL